MKANTKWFRDRLAERAMSVRGLAKKLELDPSAVSLTLRGRRKMTLAEANQIAVLLGVSVTEVIRQAGIAVADDVKGIRLLGTVDSESNVKTLKDSAIKMVSAPPDVPADGFALQIRAPQSLQDGWLIMAGAMTDLMDLMLDRPCVVTLADKRRIVGILRRGYEPDAFNIIPMLAPEKAIEDQAVTAVSPILWIRPQ